MGRGRGGHANHILKFVCNAREGDEVVSAIKMSNPGPFFHPFSRVLSLPKGQVGGPDWLSWWSPEYSGRFFVMGGGVERDRRRDELLP